LGLVISQEEGEGVIAAEDDSNMVPAEGETELGDILG